MKFKIGDRVKVIDKNNDFYGKIGKIVKSDYDFTWMVCFGDDKYVLYGDGESQLELATKTIDDLEVGDILISKYERKIKVLGICGEVYFLPATNDFEAFYEGFTLKEIKNMGYKLKEESKEIVEVSMKEIAEKFGIPVENLKIKKIK